MFDKRINKSQSKNTETSVFVWKYVIGVAVVWTVIIGTSLGWNIRGEYINTTERAVVRVRESFIKDVIYRKWAAGHGGVYVPVTEETPVNPYLSYIRERDIETPSGKKLTLVNPAYMTRQVHELGEKEGGIHGHITSLNPIRAENKPDVWEKKTLEAFNLGEREVYSIQEIDGEPYMRLMRPLVVEQRCLKCHADQGYKVGDIRGGLSVSVEMKSRLATMKGHIAGEVITYGSIWLFGLFGIFIGGCEINRYFSESKKAENDLQFMNNILEMRNKALADSHSATVKLMEDAKRSEYRLKEAKDEWKHTFNSIPDMVAIINVERIIVCANRAMGDFLKKDPEKLIGQSCQELLRKVICPSSFAIDYNYTADYKETIIKQYDHNNNKYYSIKITPFFDINGNLGGSIHIMRDITDLKKNEEELGSYADQLKQANDELVSTQKQIMELNTNLEDTVEQRTEYIEKLLEQKNRFIRQLGHDLKTPLVPLIAGLPMVQESIEDEQNNIRINRCIDSVNYINNLVEKTLHFMHASSKKYEFNGEYIDLTKIADEVTDSQQAVLKDKPGEVINSLSQPCHIFADPTAVREVIENIISNAVKYSDDANTNCITLDAVAKEDNVILTICDNGIGIEPKQLEHIFEEFYKVDPSRHDRTSIGLGLPICKGIMNKLNGSISIYSEGLGKGTKVTLEFPIKMDVKASAVSQEIAMSCNEDEYENMTVNKPKF
ncbi:MAG: DUF3365 domain-containing protein [Planctomycetes bacterium]|nr:DUF3365 domain-containing protein [Planctomycetota bacterium]